MRPRRTIGARARARELLGERELVDGDVAVHVAVRVEVCAAHRCFTPSLFV